jgi:hypothetical protein
MGNTFLWLQAHSCAVPLPTLAVEINGIHAGERDLMWPIARKIKI